MGGKTSEHEIFKTRTKMNYQLIRYYPSWLSMSFQISADSISFTNISRSLICMLCVCACVYICAEFKFHLNFSVSSLRIPFFFQLLSFQIVKYS